MCGHTLSDTHSIFVVDVGFGFEQCDGNIGTTTSSLHQRRNLRTHNDNERQFKCSVIPNVKRTSSLALMLALALISVMAISVWLFQVVTINGVRFSYERTHNDTERHFKCVGIPRLCGTTAQPCSTFGVPKLV